MKIAQADTAVAHWNQSQRYKSAPQEREVFYVMCLGLQADWTISEMLAELRKRGHAWAEKSTVGRIFNELKSRGQIACDYERKCSKTGVTVMARHLPTVQPKLC